MTQQNKSLASASTMEANIEVCYLCRDRRRACQDCRDTDGHDKFPYQLFYFLIRLCQVLIRNNLAALLKLNIYKIISNPMEDLRSNIPIYS